MTDARAHVCRALLELTPERVLSDLLSASEKQRGHQRHDRTDTCGNKDDKERRDAAEQKAAKKRKESES